MTFRQGSWPTPWILLGTTHVFLGADVPTGSLLQVIEEEKPDLLALSITMPFHASGAAAGR